MKQFILILFLSFTALAQIAPRHKFSITAGISASRPLFNAGKFDAQKLFTANVTFSFPIKNKYAANFAFVQPLRFASPQLRAGLTVRIY